MVPCTSGGGGVTTCTFLCKYNMCTVYSGDALQGTTLTLFDMAIFSVSNFCKCKCVSFYSLLMCPFPKPPLRIHHGHRTEPTSSYGEFCLLLHHYICQYGQFRFSSHPITPKQHTGGIHVTAICYILSPGTPVSRVSPFRRRQRTCSIAD